MSLCINDFQLTKSLFTFWEPRLSTIKRDEIYEVGNVAFQANDQKWSFFIHNIHMGTGRASGKRISLLISLFFKMSIAF